MEPIRPFSSRAVVLPIENIDTDQIIPARFLKTTSSQGLGESLFADWRYNADGSPKPEFILNQPQAQGVAILIAGNNFGAGSSREHAVWALTGYGFKAVISTYFADIFRNNSLKNGLLPIQVDAETHRQLFSLIAEDPTTTIKVDLEAQTITLPDGRAVTFPIDGFARRCLLDGVDQLGYLMNMDDKIATFEAAVPGRVVTTPIT